MYTSRIFQAGVFSILLHLPLILLWIFSSSKFSTGLASSNQILSVQLESNKEKNSLPTETRFPGILNHPRLIRESFQTTGLEKFRFLQNQEEAKEEGQLAQKMVENDLNISELSGEAYSFHKKLIYRLLQINKPELVRFNLRLNQVPAILRKPYYTQADKIIAAHYLNKRNLPELAVSYLQQVISKAATPIQKFEALFARAELCRNWAELKREARFLECREDLIDQIRLMVSQVSGQKQRELCGGILRRASADFPIHLGLDFQEVRDPVYLIQSCRFEKALKYLIDWQGN